MSQENIASKTPYQGLSRRYRPQNFASVMGQEAIVKTLKNAIRSQKTAQAYLFCGTRGTGKTTLARVLAKALNCQNLSLEESEPCGTCDHCVEITSGKSLNVLEIDGASNRGIDDIRTLNETVNYAPTNGGYKIFIIDESHMLTKEAFNALLKTLEEPPPNVKFFLATTEPHKIPPTILSRCQRFDLRRIPSGKILEKLVQIAKDQSLEYEEEGLHLIANLSDGSLRVAESLLDQILCFSKKAITEEEVASSLSIISSDSFFKLDEAFANYNLAFAFEWASVLFSSGKDLSYFLDCLLEHYRNLLSTLLKIPLEELPESLRSKYLHSASLYKTEQVLSILDYLIEWHQHVSKTPFKRVSLEMVLLHIIKSKHKVSLPDLILKVQQLQNGVSSAPLPVEPVHQVLSKTEQAPHSEESIVLVKTAKQTTEVLNPVSKIEQEEKPIHIEPAQPIAIQEEKKKEEVPVIIEKEIPNISSPKTEEWIEQDLLVSETPPPISVAPSLTLPEKTSPGKEQIRQETLMRFAAVELEGLLIKES